jgi:DNA-binding CsgD family transcriptional regulator
VPEDLERLATDAYLLGRQDDYVRLLDQAHRRHLEAGRPLAAVRCAFWIGVTLAQRGEAGHASGWLAGARRLLEREGGDHVERGYLLLPVAFEQRRSGDWEAAAATAAEAAEVGERFGDRDLFALAAHEQGHVLVRNGRLREGFELLDEAMLAVTAGEASPIVTGIVYCGVILACQEAYEVRRAQEWTAALTRWCESRPDLVAFTGRCLVHRAEILELRGAWPEALEEVRRAGERGEPEAFYRAGEVHRLRGELEAAEDAYREASRRGRQPQPGLALLRLAQGRPDAATGAIRRVLAETFEAATRAGLLPAYVDIMLAVGDLDAARAGSAELDAFTHGHDGGALEAMAAHARGAVSLATDDPQGALGPLRRAALIWQELDAPYHAARARRLIGLACRALGDEDAAALELESAQEALAALTARPTPAGGLTGREVEVLRRLAAGATNKQIATELVVSEHTVHRHVSNIFAKLGVSSRAAATAYAFRHGLV